MSSDVRVRFCPSPTGNPHVGMLRTALFNWAYARHTGGTFVFRIEDTDSSRDSEESVEALMKALRWMGLDWDEGPDIGGLYGPYRQSERTRLYNNVVNSLLNAGYAYPCYCTPEELEVRRVEAALKGQPTGYDGRCRNLTGTQVLDYSLHQGRKPVIRFRISENRVFQWNDLVNGEMSVTGERDFVIVRTNGEPLYTLVNPVDDALMRITHVLRGEDLRSSTPKQIAMHEALAALNIGSRVMPQFGHFPYVMGEGNRKLSKRDASSSLNAYYNEGFLPEGLRNYLALLGWSMGGDREFFSLEEMAESFTLDRVSVNPARFDYKKCVFMNAEWIRSLPPKEYHDRAVTFMQRTGTVHTPLTAAEEEVLSAAVPLTQERVRTLREAENLMKFLLIPEEEFGLDEETLQALSSQETVELLEDVVRGISPLTLWKIEDIERSLRVVLLLKRKLSPRKAFVPVQLAVTGSKVSLPLFQGLGILGREKSLARLKSAIAAVKNRLDTEFTEV